MVRIKHIAIRTPDPEKTAAFYRDVFGLKEVGQARTGYYLSDGYINLAILKTTDHNPDEQPGVVGLDHFGFLVEDLDETAVAPLLASVGRRYEFQVDHAALDFYGLCRSCKRKRP